MAIIIDDFADDTFSQMQTKIKKLVHSENIIHGVIYSRLEFQQIRYDSKQCTAFIFLKDICDEQIADICEEPQVCYQEDDQCRELIGQWISPLEQEDIHLEMGLDGRSKTLELFEFFEKELQDHGEVTSLTKVISFNQYFSLDFPIHIYLKMLHFRETIGLKNKIQELQESFPFPVEIQSQVSGSSTGLFMKYVSGMENVTEYSHARAQKYRSNAQ